MAFLMDNWYVAAWGSEVGRTPFARRILDVPLVFYRREDGSAVALVDRCPHRMVPLSLGTVVGDRLQCGYHGMTFDGDGACVRVPGQQRIPSGARIRSVPVREHWGMLWVWMGDPARAASREPFSRLPWGRPGWTLSVGPYTHVRANYRLLAENLVDPAHVSFVHASTLGTPQMADIPIETQQFDDDVILVTRWTLDQPAAPILQRFGRWPGNVDRWQYYWWHPPSIAVVDFGAHEPGTGRDEAARQAGVRIYSNHFLTPQTESSTHYFWCQLRNFALDDPEVSRDMTEQFVMAFDEDKAILEAIEAVRADPVIERPVHLALDAGGARLHRTLERLIARERGDGVHPAPEGMLRNQ